MDRHLSDARQVVKQAFFDLIDIINHVNGVKFTEIRMLFIGLDVLFHHKLCDKTANIAIQVRAAILQQGGD